MNKGRINILLVEDDQTQGKALEEAFKRAGYNTVLKDSSSGALTAAQNVEFHLLIIDCMLPKMNGVDLTLEIVKMVPTRPRVMLASGIYKDRKFIQEAMEKTKAESFSIKPYDLQALVSAVDTLFGDVLEPEQPPILKLYGAPELDAKELQQLMDQEPTLHAFHLIKLYQRVRAAGMTGELHLTSAIGDFNTISFFNGQVFNVKTPDKESFFGSLAISKGFVASEDVMDALNSPSPKMLGQKLIDSMSLSPHFIHIILTEQLALRLSQTVQDEVVSVQWTEKKFSEPQDMLVGNLFENLQADWLSSKITPDWVQSMLMAWGAFQLDGAFHHNLKGPQSVEKVLNHPQFHCDEDLLPLFVALITGDAHIGPKLEDKQDFTFLAARLDRLLADMRVQNYFQFMNVGEKAHQREISRSFENYRSTFEPSALPPHCPPEIVAKAAKVFAYVQQAYATLSNEVRRTEYVSMLQGKRAQEAMEVEPIFRAAVIELQGGHYRAAAHKFQLLLDRKIEFPDLRAYRLWTGLKLDKKYSEIRLDQIPPEERHSAPYMMAKAVYLRSQRQYKKAIEAIRTARILDPNLSLAKSELRKLAVDLQRNGGSKEMIREATSLVEGLFGRKVRKGA